MSTLHAEQPRAGGRRSCREALRTDLGAGAVRLERSFPVTLDLA